jgi:exosortase A
MPLELAVRLRTGPGLLAAMPCAWRRPLAFLALAWASALVLLLPDWAAMASQWWNISTYNHVLLVPLIIGGLTWERLPQLARLAPQAWWPGLLFVLGAAFIWVLGDFGGLSIARQLGAVLLLVGAVVALLGPQVGAVLAFPLAYSLFLVPFGDEIVPQLQMITAAITIALVHVSGVPATIDGVFIHTPAGLFEVAEACSGVKFLIAMIAFGVLAAGLCFESWLRRALFLAVCVAVPILANGVRAWATVFAAQYVGADRAAGMDHIVYGWVFFALVLALVLAISWRFFDRPVAKSPVDIEAIQASPFIRRLSALRIGAAPALVTFVGILLGSQAWAAAAERLSAPLAPAMALPEVPGWHRLPSRPAVAWEPRAQGAARRLLGRYTDADGRRVDVFVAVYAAQGEGREAGGLGEGAIPPGGLWAWQAPGPALAGSHSERMLARGRVARLAATWYRLGDLTTGSATRLKLALVGDRLLLRARPTTVLILSAEQAAVSPAQPALEAFLRAMGPKDAWMDRTAGIR